MLNAILAAVPRCFQTDMDLSVCVRNLAAAHDLGVKAQAELRTQLAAAQAATVAAEGRAKRHAATQQTPRPSYPAWLRADIENVRASLGK